MPQNSKVQFCSLQQISPQTKYIFTYVDENDEIICPFERCGGSKMSLSRFLRTRICFAYVKHFTSEIDQSIRVIPIYPGESVPYKVFDSLNAALLVFDFEQKAECTYIFCLFQFENFKGEEKVLDKLNQLIIDSLPLGHGAYGIVSKIVNKQTLKCSAMKMIQFENDVVLQSEKIQQLYEVFLQRQVKSPYVIDILEFFASSNSLFVIMEKGNENIMQYIQRQQQLELSELVNIFTMICKGLKAAHDRGIIHRDLKPHNLIFCDDGLVQLADFGHARQCDIASTAKNIGTPQYIAPELLGVKDGEMIQYTYAIDMFSLGCVLYFMLTREHAFLPNNRKPTDDPKPIANKVYPQSIIDECFLMLSREPTQRPTVDEVLQFLATYQSDVEICVQQVREIVKETDDVVAAFHTKLNEAGEVQKQISTFIYKLISEIIRENEQKSNEQKVHLIDFKNICDTIINDLVFQQKDIFQIKDEIKYLKDHFQYQREGETKYTCGMIETERELKYQKVVNGEAVEVGARKGNERVGIATKLNSIVGNIISVIGQYKQGKLEGVGKYQLRTNIFEGQFAHNDYCGKGQRNDYDGTYRGEWKDGEKCGKGQQKSTNGDIYEGDWLNGKKHGKGKMTSANGSIYAGDWLENKYQNGKATIIYTNGSSYVGDFLNGSVHGPGKYASADGSVLDGDWNEGKLYDKRSGKWIYLFQDGRQYIGDLVDGHVQGEGKCILTNGQVQEGNWVDGNCTKGTLSYPNGDLYIGDFKDSTMHGKGTYKFANGDIYEGDWVQGKRTGKGTFIYVKGNSYVGDFKEDKMHGQGIYKFANGDIYKGGWSEGSSRCGSGKCTFANGDTFEGTYYVEGEVLTNNGRQEYANGDVYLGWMKLYTEGEKSCRKRCGKGKLLKNNQEQLEGEWENDELKK